VVNLGAWLNLPHLEENLNRVEAALRTAVASEDPFLTEVSGHLIKAGGKRIRPALAVAAASAVTGVTSSVDDDVVQGGVAVELTHLGSLYHDDVIDDAATRRGVESVNARWGNLVAIVAGDFLLARASELAAGLGSEVAGVLGNTIGRLCEGQVVEMRTVFDVSRTEEAYMASIAGKTAALMAASCRIGGLTVGADESSLAALTSAGQAFGMVFQIVDDVLDVVGTDEQLGKPAGHDLVEGVYTLPTLRSLASDMAASDDLRSLLGRPLDAPEREKARGIIRSTGGVEAALGVARRFADQSVEAAAPLGPAGEPLGALGHRLLDDLAT
jgi:heptaprenyl diphosphate synthase